MNLRLLRAPKEGGASATFHGMLVMALSSVIFSLMSLMVPLASQASTYIVASSRFVTGGVAIVALGLFGVLSLKAVNWKWLVIRGLVGSISVYLYYRGIVTLGLGLGTILNYTYPVFAAILAPIILKEKLSWDVIAAVGASFIGIYMVVNPFGSGGAFLAVNAERLISLLGGLLAAVAVVSIRKLRQTDSSSVIYLAQCVFGALVIGWQTAKSSWSFPAWVWLILVGIGILATVAQLMMTYAYKHVPATEGSILAFLVPVLNVILGVVVFHETMQPLALIGSLIVLSCCIYVALRERIMRLVS